MLKFVDLNVSCLTVARTAALRVLGKLQLHIALNRIALQLHSLEPIKSPTLFIKSTDTQ